MTTESEKRLLSVMLTRAESWEKEEKIYQAMDIYFRLVENYPKTEEASKAQERLLSLAQELEAKGKLYQAMSIYERLAMPPGVMGVRYLLSPMARPIGRPLL